MRVDAVGDRLGDYELVERLGRGGMAEVWHARDTLRDRTVALKCLAPEFSERPEFRTRFRREAEVTSTLASPHVVPILDWGEVGGRLFLAMQLVPGGTLADSLQAAPGGLPPDRAVDVVGQVAEALDVAHAAGLVHRDVKPANVLLADDGPDAQCYLTDFGIMKIVDDTSGGTVTRTGEVLGTSSYTAPELYLTGEATTASDVYSLGCVLYEMLCGRRAVAATTALSAMHAHVFGPVPAPGAARPELAAFDPVIARALAKDPAARHPSASALARDAALAVRREPPAEPPTGPVAVAGSRRRLLAAAAAVVVVVLLAVVALFLTRTTTPSDADGGPPAPVTGDTPAALSAPRPLPVSFRNASSVLVAPDGRRAYVSDLQRRGVVVVDLGTGREADFLPARFGAYAMALSPDGRTLAVADEGFEDGTGYAVTLIDLASRVATSVDRSVEPGRVVFTPDSRTLYLGDHGTSEAPGTTVTAIDVTSGAVVRTVPVDARPDGMVLSPDRRTLYVACSGVPDGPTAGSIARIPLDGGAASSIPAARSPSAMVGLPDGTLRVAVQNTDATRTGIDVVDPRTATVRIRSGATLRHPYELAVTPDGRRLAVAEYAEDPPESAFSLVDAGSGAVLSRIDLPPGFGGVAVTPDGRRALLLSDTTLAAVDLPA